MLFEWKGRLYGFTWEGGPLCEFDITGTPIRIVLVGPERDEIINAMQGDYDDEICESMGVDDEAEA